MSNYLVPVFGGAYLINHLPVTLPEDKRQRDVVLSLTPYVDSAWGGILKSAIGKTIAQGYSLSGEDDPVIKARMTLDGSGLSGVLASHLKDYFCTNSGAWLRVEGYKHLDPLRIERTDGSVLYCGDDGEYEELASESILNLCAVESCVADQFYAYVHPSESEPDELLFIEGLTVNAIRGMTEYEGKQVIPILPKTPLASSKVTKHATLGRVGLELKTWKAKFSNSLSASLQDVTFSFPGETKETKQNKVESVQEPLPPIVINITMPPLTLPQMIVNVPTQEPAQISFEPAQVTVNVPQQAAPEIHVAMPEQPTPIVNYQPPNIDVSVAAPQVSVEAPSVTVEVPQTEEEIIDVKRNAEGYITQATKKRKVKK